MERKFFGLGFIAVFVILIYSTVMAPKKAPEKIPQISPIPTNYEADYSFPEAEPIEYTAASECWPDDGEKWRDISGCGDLRARTITNLASLEEERNKINLTQSAPSGSFSNTYSSIKYGFSVGYPNGWKVRTYDYEGMESVNIYPAGSDGPEITIGTGQVYSTSGALCANQGCDYEAGTVTFFNDQITQLTKSYVFIPTDETNIPKDTLVQNYRFSVPLSYLHDDFEPGELYITASFKNAAEGLMVLGVLGSLK